MYEVSVETEFCAAHALVIAGKREAIHGHNWKVTVCVGGNSLDRDGLLVDFHALEVLVRQIVAPFQNADLGQVSPFDRVNPSAEAVASHIGERVAAGLPELSGKSAGGLPARRLGLVYVRVTEAVGCAAVYRP